MPLSIDLHVKCPFYKKWNKKKNAHFFFSWNFHTVFKEQIAIFYQIFKSGSSKWFFLNVRNLQRWMFVNLSFQHERVWTYKRKGFFFCLSLSAQDTERMHRMVSWIRVTMQHLNQYNLNTFPLLHVLVSATGFLNLIHATAADRVFTLFFFPNFHCNILNQNGENASQWVQTSLVLIQ